MAFVPEFVRDFAARLGRSIDFSDHGAIARGQMALEDAATLEAILEAIESAALDDVRNILPVPPARQG